MPTFSCFRPFVSYHPSFFLAPSFYLLSTQPVTYSCSIRGSLRGRIPQNISSFSFFSCLGCRFAYSAVLTIFHSGPFLRPKKYIEMITRQSNQYRFRSTHRVHDRKTYGSLFFKCVGNSTTFLSHYLLPIFLCYPYLHYFYSASLCLPRYELFGSSRFFPPSFQAPFTCKMLL